MASEEWFESWFDSPLYEQLYSNRDDAEAARLVSLIFGKLPPERYPNVLDMGCGRGRHSIMLAEKGYTVTGVDLSPRAITQAQKCADEFNLDHIRFEIGDMRSYTGSSFNLVCNLFTSFGYFEKDSDNIQVIENMSNLLHDKGLLVMDYLNAVMVKRNIVPEENIAFGDMRCHIVREIVGDTIVKSINFNHTESGEELQYQERVKLYDEEWFRHVFNNAGLTICEYLGDYNGNVYIPEYSPRLLIVASN